MTDSDDHAPAARRKRSLPLVITAYAIIAHPKRTEHWPFLVPIDKDQVHVFQLEGNYDTFCYERSVVTNLTQQLHYDLQWGCEIGRIHGDELDWLDELLKDVKVIRNDSDIDCQNWIIEAIYLLKETEGLIQKGLGERHIREELTKEMERWEIADLIYFEREFP